MDPEYLKACELMIARGDYDTCKLAMRAITDKAAGRRQFSYNLAAERFQTEYVWLEATEDERALIARFVRNVDEVRAG